MSITSLNIKFRQSERMTDFADGGGRMSAVEIVDNQMNNVFDDRSDLDAILGRVSLRKLFLHVDTTNTDTYLGAFVFLTDPPDDPLVHVTLFNSKSATDERAAARGYVEAYRIRGPRTQLVLYGAHLAGQRTLQVYCRKEVASPDIGDIMCLSVEADGYAAAEQFVRVQEIVSRGTYTFEDASGQFERDVIMIAITTPLVQLFEGVEDPQRTTAGIQPPTRIRSTQVADAAAYYTVMPLAAAAESGDVSVRVDTPYVPLVPSSQSETPLVDQVAGLASLSMVRSGAVGVLTHAENITVAPLASATRYFGTPYARRSLAISVGATELRDDGSGGVAATSPSDTGWSGTADYATGAWSISRDVGFTAAVTATATPAGAVADQSYSQALPITGANRQLSYVFQLPAPPAPGTAVLDYRALGRWIRLSDNGAGALVGNAGEGAATINYATGTMSATLGAMPDAETAIIVAWGTDRRARNSSGEITVPTPRYRQQLTNTGIVPGSLSMSWLSGTIAKSATASAAGVLTGDATGSVDHASGVVEFTTAALPDAQVDYTYDHVDADKLHVETFTPTAAGGAISITLAHAAAANTVQAQWNVSYEVSPTLVGLGRAINVAIVDNGSGGWGAAFPGTNTINYGTGAIVLTVEADVDVYLPQFTRDRNSETGSTSMYISGYTLSDVGGKFAPATPLVIRYIEQGASVTTVTEGHALPAIRIYIGAGAAGPAIPGSLRFTFRGRTYVDRGGSLVYGVSATTNAGTVAGTYDYAANYATLTDIGAGSSNTVTIGSLLTRYAYTGVSSVFARTPGAPLRAGSFTVRATTLAGSLLTASADINGVITGSNVKGDIDWETGVYQIAFGAMVTAAGNEAEPWYDAAYVVGGQIWRPMQVDPASIFIGTVIFRAIPADPDIIGIDPVRLPTDGRVVAFQSGRVLVVHHTQTTSVASPVAGSTTNLGRTQVGMIEVFDSDGEPIDDTWYDVNLATGTVTWANPLNLSAYTLPAIIRDRIEQAIQCSDVQITGELGLQAVLTRDFPSGSLVSSAIAIGDMRARVTTMFDQQTYVPGQWLDIAQGAVAGGTYNDTTYPIAVTNKSAIDERWAIVFVSPSAVNVVGESVGQVLSAVPISGDIAPVNPVSGQPFFTMAAAGFGGGWAALNVIRFNTVSATQPIWAARTTQQGTITETTDSVRIQAYGNAH